MPSNNANEKDRWRELAELLGLPADQEPAREEPAAQTQPFDSAPPELESAQEEVRKGDEETLSDLDELGEPFENVEDAEIAEAVESLEQHFLDEEAGVNLDEDAEDMPEEAAEEGRGPATSEEDRPRRKRRRRRGRKGRGPREGQEAGESTASAVEGSSDAEESEEEGDPLALDRPVKEKRTEEEPRRGRKRRGRGRKPDDRDERVEAVRDEEAEYDDELASQEEPEEEEVRAQEADDDDDNEPDPFKDWNVPSWQELISSLYRPER